MAFSKSKQEAQVAICCKFCEIPTSKVEWKCLNCDLLMCTSCKDKIHVKFKSADKHKVLKSTDCSYKESLRLKILDTTEFSTELKRIFFMLPLEENSLLIGNNSKYKKPLGIFKSSKNLQKINIEGVELNVITDIRFKHVIVDIAVLSTGDLILCDGDSHLKQIKNGTENVIETKFSVKPYSAIAAHVISDTEIIIGAEDCDEKAYVVIIMNEEGDHLAVFKEDENGTPLFKDILVIRSTNNGIILVVNLNEPGSGNLVALSKEGKVVFIYKGYSPFGNEKHDFDPCGVAVTQSDNILIADNFADELHYISNSGRPLRRFDTLTLGISDPHSLAVCSVGETCVLYIGCDKNRSSKKAKLYQVTFIEY